MRDAIAVEALKARRSRLPWLSAAAFAVATLVGAMFMFILQDLDRARSMGLLGTKAALTGGTADWPGYFSLLAQTTAVGGTSGRRRATRRTAVLSTAISGSATSAPMMPASVMMQV